MVLTLFGTKIDKFLNGIPMYRLVVYGLALLAVMALVLSGLDIMKYSDPGTLAAMLGLLLGTCLAVNTVLSKLYNIAVSQESWIITALILFFVLSSPTQPLHWAGIAYAGMVAMASKFALTWRSSNIVNPAAVGVLTVSLMGIAEGAWWVANPVLFWPMLVLGLLVLKKLRRFTLFTAFLLPALAFILFKTVGQGTDIIGGLTTAFTLYPILFLGTIMLTEPATMPAMNGKRLLFAAIVGVLFGSQIDFGFIAATPHFALLVGNLFAFLVTLRASSRLRLVQKTQLSPTTYDFAFQPERPINHQAGQYMEFTLPGVELDARGNRRSFSLASAPQSDLVHLGVKFYEPSSAFKKRLQSLQPGDQIFANHLAGDFTLPRNTKTPLVFIAGGIGITPFISMIRSMLLSKDILDVTLYYFVSDEQEVVYKDVLRDAKKAGITIITKIGHGARLTDEEIHNHKKAIFYMSGPPGLVNAYRKQLRAQGITKIRTDYFSGY